MIKFRCSHCEQKLGVPDEYAGKRIRCNKCNQISLVPKPEPELILESQLKQPTVRQPDNIGTNINPQAAHTAPNNIELQLAPENDLPPVDPNLEALRQVNAARTATANTTAKTKHKKTSATENGQSPGWYWPLLFPIKGAALGMIGLFILCKIGIGLLAILPILTIGLVVIILTVILKAYIYWYVCLCVQTAAEGETQSPDILQEDEGDIREMITRMIRVGSVFIVCMAPSVAYLLWKAYQSGSEGTFDMAHFDSIFWSFFGAGLFFIPMSLLSVIMHDSISGLNPFTILLSIIRTPVHYLILFISFAIPLGLAGMVSIFLERMNFWFVLPAEVLSYYLTFVGAAMLGRFFYLNEDRLGWGI